MVFVKFGASAGAAERLALAGVTPRLLATGVSAVGPFVIQAYVEGRVPDGRWIEDNFEAVAEIFRLVHADAELSPFAMPLVPSVFVRSIETRVEALRQRAPLLAEQLSRAEGIRVRLDEQLPSSSRTVPTHGDPNASNFLLASDRLYLLDWDD
jgi:thiamine kinase-like enzyme